MKLFKKIFLLMMLTIISLPSYAAINNMIGDNAGIFHYFIFVTNEFPETILANNKAIAPQQSDVLIENFYHRLTASSLSFTHEVRITTASNNEICQVKGYVELTPNSIKTQADTTSSRCTKMSGLSGRDFILKVTVS